MSAAGIPGKQPVLGVGISATSYADAVDLCARWVDERSTGSQVKSARIVTATDVHGIVRAFFNAGFRAILNKADLAAPDGMPVVWAMRSFGIANQTRVYGPTLMLELCGRAAQLNYRVFLYGARQDTLDRLTERLQARFPQLSIAGTISPPFRHLTPGEEQEHAQDILASGADLVFVGLGTPKQERWMVSQRERLPGLVLLAVGAAFDFHAGRIAQAPAWMQRSGLEWLFRLTREPRRLWRRYLLVTTVFPPLWALQKLGVLRYR